MLASQSACVDNGDVDPANLPENSVEAPSCCSADSGDLATIVRNEVKRAMSEVASTRMETEARKALDVASANAYASWESQAKARFETQMKSFAIQFETRLEAIEVGSRKENSPTLSSREDSMAPVSDLATLEAKIAVTEKELRDRVVVMEIAIMGLSQKGGELRDELQKALDSQRAAMEGALDAQRAAMEMMQNKHVFTEQKLEVFVQRVMDGFESMMDSLDKTTTNITAAPVYSQDLDGEVAGRMQDLADDTQSNIAGNVEGQQADPNFSETLRVLHQNLVAMHMQDEPRDMSGNAVEQQLSAVIQRQAPTSAVLQKQAPTMLTHTFVSPSPTVQQQAPTMLTHTMLTHNATATGIRSRSPSPDCGRFGAGLPIMQPPSGVASSASAVSVSAQSLRVGSSAQSLSVPSLTKLCPVTTQVPASSQLHRPQSSPGLTRGHLAGTQLSRQQSSPGPTPRVARKSGALTRQQSSPVTTLREPISGTLSTVTTLREPLSGTLSTVPSAAVGTLSAAGQSAWLQPALQSLRKPMEVPPRMQQPVELGASNAIERLQALQKEQMQSLRKEHMHSLQLEQLRPGHVASAAFNALSKLAAPPQLQSVAASPLRRPMLGPRCAASPSPRYTTPTSRGYTSPRYTTPTPAATPATAKKAATEVDIDTGLVK